MSIIFIFLPSNKVTTKYLNVEEERGKGENQTAVKYRQEKSFRVLGNQPKAKLPGSCPPGGQGRSRKRRGGRCRKKNGDTDTLEECSKQSLIYWWTTANYIGEKAKTDISNGRSRSQNFPKNIDKLLRLKST